MRGAFEVAVGGASASQNSANVVGVEEGEEDSLHEATRGVRLGFLQCLDATAEIFRPW